jgi:single-strand DNA-binding protein
MPTTKSATTPESVSTDQVAPATARRRGPSLNRVTLVCRMAADPELRYSSSGTAMASLRVVVNDREEPEFLDVTAWRELAELAGKYLAKGRLILVEGRLHGRSWQAEDGTTRRTVEVTAANIQFLTPPARHDNADA